MRKLLYWIIPAIVSLIATSVFAYGLMQWARGNTGTPVDIAPAAVAVSQPAADVVSAVIVGDSLARGTGDQSGLGIPGRLDSELQRRGVAARRTYNFAVNGARTADLLQVLERPNVKRVLAESNVIIVSIGGNDLWGGSDWRNAAPPDPDRVMDDVIVRIEEVVNRIRATNPNARIFFVGLYNPFGAAAASGTLNLHVNRWNARLLERLGEDPDFTLIQTSDLFSHRDRLSFDRFHPSGEGYEVIARRIADSL